MRLAPLIGIEVAAFVLIVAEAYTFFTFVVPLGPVPHNPVEYTDYTLLKGALTFCLFVLWFGVIAALTGAYVRSRVGAPPPTAPS